MDGPSIQRGRGSNLWMNHPSNARGGLPQEEACACITTMIIWIGECGRAKMSCSLSSLLMQKNGPLPR